MYIKLDNYDFEKVKKASDITCTDYNIVGNMIPAENLISVIVDLLDEIDRLEEKYEDLENDLESNYRPLNNREIYGDIETL